MHAALKMAAPIAVLTFAAVTLSIRHHSIRLVGTS